MRRRFVKSFPRMGQLKKSILVILSEAKNL